MAHIASNYKEAGEAGLAADPKRKGNSLGKQLSSLGHCTCATFVVNYFGCQPRSEDVDLRLGLNRNWEIFNKIFNLSEPQFSLT